MLSTIKITASTFPEVHKAILREWNPNLSREHWQRAFVSRWPCDEEHFGYALTDGGRIVGMLGMLFSRRILAGRTVRFCNLHCWHVKSQYRAYSLALLKPIVDLQDHTITDFTPSAAVSAIAKRIGFKSLESAVLVMPPILSNGKSTGMVIRELGTPADPDAARLTPSDRQILADHQQIDCGHMVARIGTDYCYVVYSRIAPNRLPYCLVHYVSKPSFFAEHHAAIRGHLLNCGKAQFVVVESRIFEGARVPLAFRASAKEKLYRGENVPPHKIDTLYSEVALFKHSPLPSLRQRVRSTVKRCIPPAVRRYVGISAQ